MNGVGTGAVRPGETGETGRATTVKSSLGQRRFWRRRRPAMLRLRCSESAQARRQPVCSGPVERGARCAGRALAGGPPVGQRLVAEHRHGVLDALVVAPGALAVLGPQRRAEGHRGPAGLGPLHALAEDRARALDEHRHHRRAGAAREVRRAALERLAPAVRVTGPPSGNSTRLHPSSIRSRARSAVWRPVTFRATGKAFSTSADAALVTWVVKK